MSFYNAFLEYAHNMDQEESNLLKEEDTDSRFSRFPFNSERLIAGWHSLKSSCKDLHGIICAFVAAAVFAVGDICVYGGQMVSNQKMVFLSNSTVGAIMSLIIYCFQTAPDSPFKCRSISIILICGMLQTVGQFGSLCSTMNLGPGNSAALYNTMPIFTSLLMACCGNKSLLKANLSLSILCIIGVIMISRNYIMDDERGDEGEESDRTKTEMIFAMVAGLVSAITHGSILVIRQLTTEDNITSCHFTLSFFLQYAAIAYIVCIVQNGWAFPAKIMDAILLSSSGLTAFIGNFIMIYASSIEDSSTVAIILTSSVGMSYIGQTIIYDIPLEWMSLLGGFLICCACVCVSLTSLYTENQG